MVDEEANGTNIEEEGSPPPSKRQALAGFMYSPSRPGGIMSLEGAFSKRLVSRELKTSRRRQKRLAVGSEQPCTSFPSSFEAPAPVVAPSRDVPSEDARQKSPVESVMADVGDREKSPTVVERPQSSQISANEGELTEFQSQFTHVAVSIAPGHLHSSDAPGARYIGPTPSFEGFSILPGSRTGDVVRGGGRANNTGLGTDVYIHGRLVGYTESFQGFPRQCSPLPVRHDSAGSPASTQMEDDARVERRKGKQKETSRLSDSPNPLDRGSVEVSQGPSNPLSNARKQILRTLSAVQVASDPNDDELGMGEKRLVCYTQDSLNFTY